MSAPAERTGSGGEVAVASADLPEGGLLHAEVGGQPVCLARLGGRVHALRDVCSHAEVALSEGDLEDGGVECWLHGSAFDLETGAPSSLPAVEPVPVYAVEEVDGQVLVDTSRDVGAQRRGDA